jgi:hypothetical protein
MDDLYFAMDNPKQAFVAKMKSLAETTIAVSGNWVLRKEDDHYSVSNYGNFKGWFNSLEKALNVIPPYFRESIKRQADRHNAPKQMDLLSL